MSEAQKTLREKYYPTDFSQVFLPERIRELIEKNKDRKGYKLLFYGPAGTGKSTTARLMTPRGKYEVLSLSGSNNFTVDTVNTKIAPFITSHAHILGKQKVIIVDECERMSSQVQDSWKDNIDKAKNINIIFITNHPEKLTSPIKSRFEHIEFNFKDGELQEQQRNYVQNIINICKAEEIPYDADGVKYLFKKNFPDFRKVLNILQQFKDAKTPINLSTAKGFNDTAIRDENLYAVFSITDPAEFYGKLTEYTGNEETAYFSLSTPFFEWLNEQGKFEKTLKVAKIVAYYSNMHQTSFNKTTTFIACCNDIREALR